MKIVICSSTKYHDIAQFYSEELTKKNIKVFCPPKVSGTDNWDLLSDDEQRVKLKNLIDEHFKEINSSDAVLIINKDGYIGTSVNIEIGYALAKSKRIFTIEPDSDLSRSTLFEAVIKNPTEIVSLLTNRD